MESRLYNAQKISQRSQLHNAHRDVDVGRVVANKTKYCNPKHFDISYFRNPKPFLLFGFTFMQWITWTLALITSTLCFLIWIGWQWEPKLSLCTTYSILFVNVYGYYHMVKKMWSDMQHWLPSPLMMSSPLVKIFHLLGFLFKHERFFFK